MAKYKVKARKLSPKQKSREWEWRNVIAGAGYHTKASNKSLKKSMATRGYEAMRVSPQTTTIKGKKYRKVFGASVEPDYSMNRTGKAHPKVKWYHQGYVKATAKQKTGTTRLQDLRYYPVNQKTLKSQLMERPRKRKTSKRKSRR